ncbi:MAG: T9SS type A sorting domain-containing protein, partial [Saprospiraceae bacterium]
DNAGNDDFAIARYLSGLEIVGTSDPVSNICNMMLYPNPILKEAILKFNLSEDQPMIIRLYDLSGKVIQSFCEGIHRSKGENQEKLIFNPSILPGNYILNVETRNSIYGIPVILRSQY